ncbi:response regulator transcription factor [Dehalogenimonas alkenigignens]|uniref:Response regulators consisting of a CheY-like receiver domain and a winged-helix DNA-binding domain n=1 Tax=Dehalogenimonas alkenigignens TaxID=1217799 RepID=A0A0W0GIA0_9CHLR|nr:response regulator transcription factor [Dehalogenimonas alkenigignens]KTB48292.1 Response regulators consisting of a CheY-like receiver domain and a winged-helix DNA-binding domain [Dehalogenimonas alkenigignens]PVV82632.1 DNA-binding response regulator [Dehalogenimonas alkenigignens]
MKVLVIEDDPDVAEFITLALGIGWPGVEIELAESGEKGVELVGKNHPDVVTVDLGLPGMNGFEAIKSIRTFSRVPIIVLTVRGEERDIVRGLELGADEYVVKPFGQMELIARIRALMRRHQAPPDDAPVVCGRLSLDFTKRIARIGVKEAILTSTEAIILKHLISKEGVIVPHAALAERIWGASYPEAADAIKVHIRHLREKIEDNPGNPRIILTRFGVGYFLVKPG